MGELALPLLRQAAVLGMAHSWLGRLSVLGTTMATKAATMDDEPWCDGGGCHGYEYCPAGYCNGAGCGAWCNMTFAGCESGGSCWRVSEAPLAERCCDCFCCPPAENCFYCICNG